MEVSIGDYGRMMFEMMIGNRPYPVSSMPDHWRSVREEALPLVEQLLALNEKMVVDGKPGGYKIHGYRKEGKPVLSKHERIRNAQDQILGFAAADLKEGDRVWLRDLDMAIGFCGPTTVEIVREDYAVVEVEGRLRKVYKSHDRVLKAPADFYDKQDEYESDAYWLKKADELGI